MAKSAGWIRLFYFLMHNPGLRAQAENGNCNIHYLPSALNNLIFAELSQDDLDMVQGHIWQYASKSQLRAADMLHFKMIVYQERQTRISKFQLEQSSNLNESTKALKASVDKFSTEIDRLATESNKTSWKQLAVSAIVAFLAAGLGAWFGVLWSK